MDGDRDEHDFDFPTARAIMEIHGWIVQLTPTWGQQPQTTPARTAYDKLIREQQRLLGRFTNS